MAGYAYMIASGVRSPEGPRATGPNVSAKVSDAKQIASHRFTACSAKLDFPAPGTPQTIIRWALLTMVAFLLSRQANEYTGIVTLGKANATALASSSADIHRLLLRKVLLLVSELAP